MTILKVMFIIAIGTYVAYELTTRKKNILPGSGKKQLESDHDRTSVANI
jgi:hypothetical protein